MDAYTDAVAYLRTFAAMISGMGVGFLLCQLAQPQHKSFGVAMSVVLFVLAWWMVQYGPDVLLVKP